MIYIVKSAETMDSEGMELDPIRFVTLDKEKAEAFVAQSDSFLWIDGYELDSGKMVHVL